jgi:phenylalanyl-tRNA synthetase alpha chain
VFKSHSLLELEKEFEQDQLKLTGLFNKNDVENLRVQWLGRKGILTQQYANLKNLSKEDKPLFGKQLNQIRINIEKKLSLLKEKSLKNSLTEILQRPDIDVTLPVDGEEYNGSIHPVSMVRKLMFKTFHRYGFSVFEGPEIESDDFNFSHLNIAEDHPARDMQDTFFVQAKKPMVLRTHTSNVQIYSMLKNNPPLRFISPGRVFRVDNDATHSPMFHQMECVMVDKGVSFAHLKGIIKRFVEDIFGSDVKMRLRPSFFPFVEPGAEVDIFGSSGWLEIGGCGMIHPNVFKSVGYAENEYSGYAFGFGIDRMAMLLYGIKDLRQMFEADRDFLSKFPIY